MINKINYKSKNLILSIAAIGVGTLTVIVTATQALNGEWFIEQKDKASVSENLFFTPKASLSVVNEMYRYKSVFFKMYYFKVYCLPEA